MGAPEKADEKLIPDFHWNDDPDWYPVGDYMHLDCHYQLLADNLMDLSHEAYVHRGTIGPMRSRKRRRQRAATESMSSSNASCPTARRRRSIRN